MDNMDTLKSKLEATLKDAMRANDDVCRRTIRMVLAAIKLSEVEKGAPLDDNSILAIIQKEVENRREINSRCAKSQPGRPGFCQ